MKKSLLIALAVLILSPLVSVASDVNVNVNLDLGRAGHGPLVIEDPPLFLVPPSLGFRVAVGVSYEMVMLDGSYFVFHAGNWHRGPDYDGPWVVVAPSHLPPGLRKHHREKIIEYRDEEYHHYRKDKSRYHGKSFHPEKKEKHHDKKGKKEKGNKGHHD